MADFYINEQTIYWLALLILNTAICGYFLNVRAKTRSVWLLIGLFMGLECFYISTIFQGSFSLLLFVNDFQRKTQLIFILASLIFLTQFGYAFPYSSPKYQTEQTIAFITTLIFLISGVLLSSYALTHPTEPEIYSFLFQLLMILLELGWFISVMLRRSYHFRQIQDLKAAEALRSFLTPFALTLIVVVAEIASTLDFIPQYVESLFLSFGLLGFHFLFTLAYINYSPQTVTFMVKLVGITLVTVLLAWGNMGNFLVPYFREIYRDKTIMPAHTMLAFTPNQQQSYDIRNAPFTFDPDIGTPLTFSGLNIGQLVKLPFTFEYFNNSYQHIQVMPFPTVIMTDKFMPSTTQIGLYYPTIYVAAVPRALLKIEPNTVFYKATPTHLVITWQNLHLGTDEITNTYTIQLTLFADNRFTIAYQDLPSLQQGYKNSRRIPLEAVGIYPGNLATRVNIDWSKDLPYSGVGARPIVQDYYQIYQRYIHDRLVMIAAMLLIISFFIVFGFPFFFYSNLVKPLQNLIIGVRAVNAGDLNTAIIPKFNDEIGFLTESFNNMVASIGRTQTNILQSEKKYRALFEDSKDLIFIAQLTGQIIEVNPVCQALLGYTPAELKNKSIHDWVVQPNPKAFEYRLTHDGIIKDYELHLRHRHGQIIDVLLTATLGPADQTGQATVQGILRDITAQKEAEQERIKFTAIQQELSIAHDIQQSLLPHPRPNWSHPEVICFSTPARRVGGDFYQYRQFPHENRYAFAIGDVSGKGISAALLMATSLSQFDAALSLDLSPAERMTHLDKAICPYTQPRRQNCAMIYVELEVRSDELGVMSDELKNTPNALLYVVNAGCIPPYIKRADGSVLQPEMGGFALGQGLGAELGYQQHTFELYPGDMVILTSDGVVEANNGAEMLGFDRLLAIMAGQDTTTPIATAEAMLTQVQHAVFAFTAQTEPHDDITMMVIRV